MVWSIQTYSLSPKRAYAVAYDELGELSAELTGVFSIDFFKKGKVVCLDCFFIKP